MNENLDRRDMLKLATLFVAMVTLECAFPKKLSAQSGASDPAGSLKKPSPASGYDQNGYALEGLSNFKAVYENPELKAAFFLFLKNVYNLFPEDKFHKLIEEATQAGHSDKEIYQLAQARIGTIKPLLSEVRYALPALARQKAEMARQTKELLSSSRKINGYMEVGTTGRYISKFQSSVELKGDVVLLNIDKPTYSPTDIVERGQIGKLGRFVPLKDYAPITSAEVPDKSMDLIANFIGFHHSPPVKRDAFVKSLHRVLRPGARMILRDHDVNSGQMNRIVALAHDVFNMGLGTEWSVNQSEIRNFTSMKQIVAYLEGLGFKSTKRSLFQPGDPTQNALMEFVKV